MILRKFHKVWFSWMEFISDPIMSCEFVASVVLIISCYVVDSPESEKNNPREYLLDGWDSLSNLRDKTRLTGSSILAHVARVVVLLTLMSLKIWIIQSIGCSPTKDPRDNGP